MLIGWERKEGSTMEATKTRCRVIFFLTLLISFFLIAVSSAQSVEKVPFKVGLLLPYTGPFPLQAKGITNGIQLSFDEIGQKAGGREIQLFKEDTEANPNVGLTKVRRLVERDKVNFIVGPVSSGVAMAIHDYITKQKLILINPCAFTRELTSPEKARKNIFRVVETTDQGNYPMGKWIYKNTHHRKIVAHGMDYLAGHHSVEAFKAAFEEAGGKVIKEVYAKVGTMDFSSFLAAMDVEGADAVYAFTGSIDAIRFVQQYQEFGLKKRLPLFGYVTLTDDPYLDGMGEAALGIITSSHYPPSLDTPANRAFVTAYRGKYGEPPSRYSEYGYVSGKLIGAAVEALKGEIEDISTVAMEFKRVASQIVSPSGPLEFDQYNQRIVNLYVLKTEKRDGKLVNVVIDKIGKVAQEDVWKWWNK